MEGRERRGWLIWRGVMWWARKHRNSMKAYFMVNLKTQNFCLSLTLLCMVSLSLSQAEAGCQFLCRPRANIDASEQQMDG